MPADFWASSWPAIALGIWIGFVIGWFVRSWCDPTRTRTPLAESAVRLARRGSS